DGRSIQFVRLCCCSFLHVNTVTRQAVVQILWRQPAKHQFCCSSGNRQLTDGLWRSHIHRGCLDPWHLQQHQVGCVLCNDGNVNRHFSLQVTYLQRANT